MEALTPIHVPPESAVDASQLTDFARFAGQPEDDWPELHAWSIAHMDRFWTRFLDWAGVIHEGELEPALAHGDDVERARFFPNLRLSFVENLLERPGFDDDSAAILAADEGGGRVRISRGELRDRVRRVAAGLRARGVAPHDRVVAIVKNGIDAVVACLAATGLGAIWSSVATELAVPALLDRFRPLAPRWLIHDESQTHHGATRDLAARAQAAAAELPGVTTISTAELDALAEHPPIEAWPRMPFNHPLFILFSSGTTGPPKCIVHGVGGTLIEHLKEHRLHGDVRPGDRMLFMTSAGWMMWNWQVSALGAGAEIVVYDGSVTFPEEDSLWRLCAEESVTLLGTSAAYVALCRDSGMVPRELADLRALRAIYTTGSVLHDHLFHWLHDNVGDVPVCSISGGTDIVGCFALGNPNLPVYAGELQCLGLGMDVRALGAGADGIGELICARPFPSRPVALWADPDGKRFHDAYFAANPGVWTHGDFIQTSETGGIRVLGRSDGVLNVRGIRIGPAEIYRALEAVTEIAELMALEQQAPAEPGGSRLVLLVVLRAGLTLDRPLTLRIKKEISVRCSMNHVPAVVAQVAELPTTHSGKRSERAARDAINGREIANLGALRNPGCLEEIAKHPALAIE